MGGWRRRLRIMGLSRRRWERAGNRARVDTRAHLLIDQREFEVGETRFKRVNHLLAEDFLDGQSLLSLKKKALHDGIEQGNIIYT